MRSFMSRKMLPAGNSGMLSPWVCCQLSWQSGYRMWCKHTIIVTRLVIAVWILRHTITRVMSRWDLRLTSHQKGCWHGCSDPLGLLHHNRVAAKFSNTDNVLLLSVQNETVVACQSHFQYFGKKGQVSQHSNYFESKRPRLGCFQLVSPWSYNKVDCF